MTNSTVKGSSGCIACLYTNWSEPYPWVHAVASVLSAGPTAPGDKIGSTNVSLVSRTCTEDGTLLKPDRPATPLDSYWSVRAFGPSVPGPRGEVWTTETRIDGGAADGHSWLYAFGTMLAAQYSLTLNDLTAAATAWPANYAAADNMKTTATSNNIAAATINIAEGTYVVWDFWAGPASATVFSDAIVFPAGVDYGAARFFIAAPVLSNGWAVLGEAGKFISVARQRFSEVAVTEDKSGVRVRVVGSEGEKVAVVARDPAGKVGEHKCTLSADGTATLSLPSGKCV